MIDNFAPQPYPLECSRDGDTWSLVIGWRQNPNTRLQPVVAWPDGGITTLDDPSDQLRYRPADTRPVAPRPTASAAARVEPAASSPRRERLGS